MKSESVWLICKGNLCLSREEFKGQIKWVTFTDRQALGFPSKEHADIFLKDRSDIPAFHGCAVEEHMFMG